MANSSKDAELSAEHELKDVSAGQVPHAMSSSSPGADDQVRDQTAPGKNLLPDEADAVAGAVPPPTTPEIRGGPGPGPQPPDPGLAAPGTNLEIETLEGAAAGTLTRTIRVKIEDADLIEPIEPVD